MSMEDWFLAQEGINPVKLNDLLTKVAALCDAIQTQPVNKVAQIIPPIAADISALIRQYQAKQKEYNR